MGATTSRRSVEDPSAPLFGNRVSNSNAILSQGASNAAGAALPPLQGVVLPGGACPAGCGDEGPVCAICIGGLSMAPQYALPACGHIFHGVCIASAVQVQPLCPLCRAEVSPETAQGLIAQLAADTVPGTSSALFAEELQEDLKKGGRTPKSEIPEETIIAGLQHAASCKGDHSKIPSIAALLGRGEGAVARTQQSDAVRLAAVQALRAIVPTFSESWPGLPHVLDLLRGISVKDPEDEVRCAAIQAIQEVGKKGDATDLVLMRELIESRATAPDVRLRAANAVYGLAKREDACSREAAMSAFTSRDCAVQSVGFNAVRTAAGTRGECPELIADLAKAAETHCDSEVRAKAVSLIGQFEEQGGGVGITAALGRLEDAEQGVREAAIAALRSLWCKGDMEAISTLARLVGGGTQDAELRVQALGMLSSLANRGDATATAVVALALGDETDSVRLAAMSPLKDLCSRGDREVVRLLLGHLASQSEDVQMLAVEALGWISEKGDAEVLAALQRLRSQGDEMEYAVDQAFKHMQ